MPRFHVGFQSSSIRAGFRLLILIALYFPCWEFGYGDDTAIQFFESNIRPVLIDRCQNCHGSKKQSGGLRLDSRASLLKGGDTGPVVVPNAPSDSLLVHAIRHEGDYAMPPKGQLSERAIRDIEQWIKLGAPWPESSDAKDGLVADMTSAKVRNHWAFQKVLKPAVPAVDLPPNASPNPIDASAAPVDAFVQRKLAEHQLSGSGMADRRTLIRRLTYSLTGLPPTVGEVRDYLNDREPHAYQRLVDRLLDSVQYGEHWARHWLDVARYSDTKGYVYGREERFWTHAWLYRDWVVASLNADMPYDRFLLLQLAADQVEDRQQRDLAAMGFLTLGRRFLGVRREIIDDRIDVVCRGTMGLTVSCARCHDHKFDPIPAADYYSLYGVFDSCIEQLVSLGDPGGNAADSEDAFRVELLKRQTALADKMARRRSEADLRVRNRIADYLFAQSELEKYPANGFDQIFAKDDLLPAVVRRWSRYLRKAARGNDPIFEPWRRFSELSDDAFAKQAGKIIDQIQAASSRQVNPNIAMVFDTPPTSMRDVCNRYAQAFVRVGGLWQAVIDRTNASQADPPVGLSDPHAESLRAVLFGLESPCQMPPGSIIDCETYFDSAACTELWKLQGEIDRWIVQSEQPVPYALTLQDSSKPAEPRIFRRGDPLNLGRDVPRQFLSIIAGPQRQPFRNGSGRLELARAITHPDNPLTARVMVNRVWLHHFGQGLVLTPSDFGTRAAAPSHPELLDWLTIDFIKGGWSLKMLHRRILMSAAYRQSSSGPTNRDQLALALQTDPDNRLLWRVSPRRLGFEELRDSVLSASGQLDRTSGGKPAPLFKEPYPTRRTLYGLVDRQYLPGTLRMFDFANPDLHVPKRSETTVPQQALFFMNHPWMLKQARELSELSQASAEPRQRVSLLFRRIMQREPTETEIEEAFELVTAANEQDDVAVRPTIQNWTYGYGVLDEAAGAVTQFSPLPHFTGSSWQGGDKFPDPALGWVQLTARGGHPGNDQQHAAIRRWTVDRDMSIRIRSELKHEPTEGDGIRAFIVSSVGGIHHSVTLHHDDRQFGVDELAVTKGDVVDFVVDIGKGLNNDQYLWKVVIEEVGDGDKTIVWDSSADFPPPVSNLLDGWEQLAQVLLCSNEFMFVD